MQKVAGGPLVGRSVTGKFAGGLLDARRPPSKVVEAFSAPKRPLQHFVWTVAGAEDRRAAFLYGTLSAGVPPLNKMDSAPPAVQRAPGKFSVSSSRAPLACRNFAPQVFGASKGSVNSFPPGLSPPELSSAIFVRSCLASARIDGQFCNGEGHLHCGLSETLDWAFSRSSIGLHKIGALPFMFRLLLCNFRWVLGGLPARTCGCAMVSSACRQVPPWPSRGHLSASGCWRSAARPQSSARKLSSLPMWPAGGSSARRSLQRARR